MRIVDFSLSTEGEGIFTNLRFRPMLDGVFASTQCFNPNPLPFLPFLAVLRLPSQSYADEVLHLNNVEYGGHQALSVGG